MSVNEIEVVGSTISLQAFNFHPEQHDEESLFHLLFKKENKLDIGTDTAGFHDVTCDLVLVRGWFSVVVPFEVEHLVEGATTKSLLKRLESCEFFAGRGVLLATGKAGAIKAMCQALAGVAACTPLPMHFEFHHLSQFQDRLSLCKAISLTNPKDRQVRKCKLAGAIESYTDFNVIDPRNHGIDQVAGLIDTPLSPMTVAVSAKGCLRLTVRKGFILTFDCLLWLLKIALEEKIDPLPFDGQPEANDAGE